MPNNNLPVRSGGLSLARGNRQLQRVVSGELARINAVEDIEAAKIGAIQGVAMNAMIATSDLVALGSILVERDPTAAGLLETEVKIAAHAMGNRLLDLNRKLG